MTSPLLSVSAVSHYPRGHHASTSSQPSFPSPNGAIQQNAKNDPRPSRGMDTSGGLVTKNVSKLRSLRQFHMTLNQTLEMTLIQWQSADLRSAFIDFDFVWTHRGRH